MARWQLFVARYGTRRSPGPHWFSLARPSVRFGILENPAYMTRAMSMFSALGAAIKTNAIKTSGVIVGQAYKNRRKSN